MIFMMNYKYLLLTMNILLMMFMFMFMIPTFNINIFIFSFFTFSFQYNIYSKMFLLFIMVIGMSILMFSKYYMNSGEIFIFNMFMFMFMLFMIILTSSDNLFSMYIGWEGVGLMSYLLISWYSSRMKSSFSGKKAMYYNRIGDFFFFMLIGLSLLQQQDMIQKTLIINSNNLNIELLLILMLMLCVMVKSAQFIFHPWLTSAMEGPIPVSSLLHSSTMVVAGVYFMFQMYYIMSQSSVLMLIMMIISSMTSFLTSISAFYQKDIKKVIALSTTSQLSFMIFTMSMGLKDLAFLHLILHGFFKALLFLSGGVFIHHSMNNQDIRKMMYMFNLNYLKSVFFFSNLGLMGIPFIGAYFSKHKILEMLNMNTMNLALFIIMMFSFSFTIGYSMNLYNNLFKNNYNYMSTIHLENVNYAYVMPFMILMLLIIYNFNTNQMFFNQMLFDYYFNYLLLMFLLLGYLMNKMYVFKKKNYMFFYYWYVGNFNQYIFFLMKLFSEYYENSIEMNMLVMVKKMFTTFNVKHKSHFFLNSFSSMVKLLLLLYTLELVYWSMNFMFF